MRSFMRKAVVLAAVATLALQPVLAQAQVAVGNANKIVSAVQGVLQTNTRTLVLKDDVFSNENVNTGANSAARFIFRDDTMLSIGASSSVTLDNFIFDSDASKSQVAMSMSKGVMRFVSGKLPKNLYSIRTPTALIGIRGTILVITVAANGLTNVSVIEGTATVSAAGTTTAVDAGFSTSVSPGAPPTPPHWHPARATAAPSHANSPGPGARHCDRRTSDRTGRLIHGSVGGRRGLGGSPGGGHRGGRVRQQQHLHNVYFNQHFNRHQLAAARKHNDSGALTGAGIRSWSCY